MRECWDLPSEDELSFSGPEWLLQLIDRNNAGEAARLLLILWRAWYVRNELTHGGRWIPTEGSVNFLFGYWATLSSIKQGGAEDDEDIAASDAYTLKSDSSTTWTSFPSRIPETVCTKMMPRPHTESV